MAQKFKRKKRNLFLNQEMQGKFVFQTFVVFLISFGLFVLFFGILTLNTQTMVYEGYQLKFGKTPLILWKQMVYGNWMFIVLGGGVLVIFSTLLTHRFAGPLFRFEKCINNMLQGDLTDTIYLRGKDEGKQLSHKINQFNADLSNKIRAMQNLSIEMENVISEISKGSAPQADEKGTALFDKMAQTNQDLKNLLHNFKILDEKT